MILTIGLSTNTRRTATSRSLWTYLTITVVTGVAIRRSPGLPVPRRKLWHVKTAVVTHENYSPLHALVEKLRPPKQLRAIRVLPCVVSTRWCRVYATCPRTRGACGSPNTRETIAPLSGRLRIRKQRSKSGRSPLRMRSRTTTTPGDRPRPLTRPPELIGSGNHRHRPAAYFAQFEAHRHPDLKVTLHYGR